MHLAVDCTYQSVVRAPGGGATFLRELIPRLQHRLDPNRDRLTVFCSAEDASFYRRLAIHCLVLPTRPPLLRGVSTHVLGPLMARWQEVDVLLLPGNFSACIKTTPQVVVAQSVLTFRHFPMELGHVKTLYRRVLTARTVRHSDALVFLSQAQQEEFARAYSLNGLHRVIYPGAPTAPARDRGPRSGILVVSALWGYKNLDTVLDIAIRLRERQVSRPVWIVGDGPQRAALSARIRHEGLSRMVTLLGAKPLDEVYALYHESLVTLHLSRAESFGFPVLESMAFGVPALIADQPALREVAGRAGLVIKNAEQGADYIARLDRDAVLWNHLSGLARQRAREFSWDEAVDAILEVCQMAGRACHAKTAAWGLSSGPSPR